MGLSASQGRFLSLQNRKSRIGNDLITLSNRKHALSREMKIVSNYYADALKQTSLKFSVDSGQTTFNLNYDILMKPNEVNCESPYIVTDKQGRVVVDDNKIAYDGITLGVSYKDIAAIISKFSGVDSSGNLTWDNINNVDANEESGTGCTILSSFDHTYSTQSGLYDNAYNLTGTLSGTANDVHAGSPEYTYPVEESMANYYINNNNPAEVSLRNYICNLLGLIDTGLTEYTKGKLINYFDAIFRMIAEKGWVYDEQVNDTTDHDKSEKYLNEMLKNNQYFLTEAHQLDDRSHFTYITKQTSSIIKIYEVQNDDAITKAYSDYVEKRTEISAKEKKIDHTMTLLETEQEAIETELESIKKVKNENIDEFFRIFA